MLVVGLLLLTPLLALLELLAAALVPVSPTRPVLLVVTAAASGPLPLLVTAGPSVLALDLALGIVLLLPNGALPASVATRLGGGLVAAHLRVASAALALLAGPVSG